MTEKQRLEGYRSAMAHAGDLGTGLAGSSGVPFNEQGGRISGRKDPWPAATILYRRTDVSNDVMAAGMMRNLSPTVR